MTQIELLRQFVARLVKNRDKAGLHEAINLAQHLQMKLFDRPAADFLQLEASEQVQALLAGVSPADGCEKCLTYATLLQATATLYQLQGRDDLTLGARQLALYVALSAALNADSSSAPAGELVDHVRAELGDASLLPPVQELLDQYDARR